MRIELSGHRSDVAVAWERLGDTDAMNRRVDGGAMRVRLEPRPGGAPRIVGAMAGPLGLDMPFEEPVNGWVRRRWFRQERVYQRAPIAASRVMLTLEPDGDGVRPHITLDLEPSLRVFAPAIRARANAIRAGWQAALDALPRPFEPAQPAIDRELPAPLRAALVAWRGRVDAGVAGAVEDVLRTRSEHELRSIRAYGVADRYGLDREATLAGLLRAVPAGLLELYWSVRCTRCRGEVAATTSLSNLADHADCPSCGVAFTADLAQNVEVLFAPHPAVMPRIAERFCSLFPAGAPTLHASLPLPAGASIDEAVVVDARRYTLGVGQGAPDVAIEVAPDGARAVQWAVGDAGERRVAPGEVRVAAFNPTTAPQRLLLIDTEVAPDVVPAADVASVPEFRRELGLELLSAGSRVGSRRVALLFTDLSGSTAMYGRLGDAAAYALVRDHFEVLRTVIAADGGTVVKTIGDAVMASFDRTDRAVAAAIEARRRFDAWIRERYPHLDVRLNVGVHVGMALAVHSDDAGLDWFGQNVNLAARAQGAAKNGDLVLTDAVVDDPLVAAVIGDLPLEAFVADLKGIGPTRLHRSPRPAP